MSTKRYLAFYDRFLPQVEAFLPIIENIKDWNALQDGFLAYIRWDKKQMRLFRFVRGVALRLQEEYVSLSQEIA
jgi:hypothetical protein